MYYLNRICSFHYNVFSINVLQQGFCSLNVAFSFTIRSLHACLQCFKKVYRGHIVLKLFIRICWKHSVLQKINSTADALMIICRKCLNKTFLWTTPDTFVSCFNSQLILRNKWTKLQMELAELRASTLLTIREISSFEVKNCVIYTGRGTFWNHSKHLRWTLGENS